MSNIFNINEFFEVFRKIRKRTQRKRIKNLVDKKTKNNSELPSDLIQLYEKSLKKENDIDASNANEKKTLENIINDLKILDGVVVDIGAGDGYTGSCTFGLFSRSGWSGLAIEGSTSNFYTLAYLYSSFDRTNLARIRITPNNIADTLEAYSIPKNFDVLNLDIDSYDLFVIEALLRSGFRPKVITMEVNEKIPPGIFFSVKYSENHSFKQDHFYGCSLDAAFEVLSRYEYILYKLEYNNAFFIGKEYAPLNYQGLMPRAAYMDGYLNRPKRKKYFRYNQNVDYWQTLDIDDAIIEIRKFFSKYDGSFILSKISVDTQSK
jgi:hypothetical protein